MNKDGKFHNLIEFYFLPSKLWLEVLTLIGIIELISLYFKMSIKLYWMDIIGKFDMRCPPPSNLPSLHHLFRTSEEDNIIETI